VRNLVSQSRCTEAKCRIFKGSAVSEAPYTPNRTEKAVSFLVMAKRILDSWPKETSSEKDAIAAQTAAQLIKAAIEQLTTDRERR
jgi:hypothetical protein